MDDWQAIDSAPRDGTRVDLGMSYKSGGKWKFLRAPDCYWHKKKRQWFSKWYGRDGYSALQAPFNPTHWMLTPAAPAILPQSDEVSK